MGISQFPPASGGIPTGVTGARPGSPSTGDVFYDGTVGALMMYDGSTWVPCSAPTAMPTIAVADVGTNIAYGSAQGAVTFTEQTSGGNAIGYTVSSSTGGYSATSTSNTFNITVGNSGSWTFSGTAYNAFGVSAASPAVTQTLTTVPETPTIGTTTASASVSELTVNWTLGNNGGKALTSITIIPYLNGTTAQTPVTAASTSSTSYTFTNLTVDAEYTFKVKATNANGDSALSSASNQIAVPSFFNVDYFILAGGGGGGNVFGGGGGAGGLRSTISPTGGGASAESQLTIAKNTNYTVTVGAGGSGSTAGSNSVFYSITSLGGGRGGYYDGIGGGSGGSGGGGGGGDGTPGGGAGTTGQGYAGGIGRYNPSGNYRPGGGGGGAGAVGDNSGSSAGGNGGAGVTNSFSGTAITYAGGGGGSSYNASSGSGGNGGGGNGSAGNGSSGTTNRGGGGGGAGSYNTGGSGGSGIIYIKYPDTKTITIGAGLTGSTAAASGGYIVTTITAGTGNVSFA